MKLFLQKKCKIFERWGLRPQAPVPPAAGGFAPEPPASGAGSFASRPPLASGGWGLRPQNLKTAPHCEFLATRLREFTKLPTGLSFFVVVASAVATMRPGAPSPTNDCLCPPPFWFNQNAFLDHRVTTRQQAIMEKGIIIFKHDSRLKFSRLFAKLLATNCFT